MNESRTTSQFKGGIMRGLGIGTGISIAFVTTTLFAAAAAMNVFSPGQVISSSELNQNFAMAAPEGTINAFYLASCPQGWAIADGTNGTPDLRGRFIRGMDDAGSGAANVDPDGVRALGSEQLDAFQGHWHQLLFKSGSADEPASLSTSNYLSQYVGGISEYSYAGVTADTANTRIVGNAVTDASTITPRTTTETRPRNIALIYCMRKN